MTYRDLPEYTSDARITLDSLKQDKIELEIGYWHIDGNADDASAFAQALSDTPFGSFIVDGVVTPSFPFNRPRGRYLKEVWFFAGRNIAALGEPLIQGKIFVRPNGHRFSVSAQITVNPTRMLQQCPLGMVARHLGSFEFPMCRVRPIELDPEEHLLIPADNLLSGPAVGWMRSSFRWRRFRRAFFNALDDGLNDLMGSVASQCGLTVRRDLHFNLRLAETYAEFQHADPVRLVNQLWPSFRTLGQDARCAEHLVTHGDTLQSVLENEGFSPCLRIRLNQRTEVKIYTKTSRRIRLELVRKSGRDPHTYHDRDELHAALDQHEDSALEPMNVVLEHLTAHSGSGTYQLSAYELLRELMEAVPDRALCRLLTSSLINQGAYVTSVSVPLTIAIRRLRARGVLVSVRRRGYTYRLADQYQQARAILAQSFPQIFGEPTSPVDI